MRCRTLVLNGGFRGLSDVFCWKDLSSEALQFLQKTAMQRVSRHSLDGAFIELDRMEEVEV